MLEAAVRGWFLAAFSVVDNRNGLSISHLLYTDDTLIFCDVDSGQLKALKAVLLCFEVVSGLKVNLGKSELVPVGEVENIDHLADLLGCKVAALPMCYLRLPF